MNNIIKEIKVFGTDKSIENGVVMRRSLNDEESIYCSIFEFYPRYRCGFSVHCEDRSDRNKKIFELYSALIEDGFGTFYVGYTNVVGDDDDDENEELEEFTTEMIMNCFILFKNNCLISFGNDWGGISILSHESPDVIQELINKHLSKYVVPDDKVRCNIIAHDHNFYLEEFEIKLEGDLDYDLYNEGFKEINDEIIRSIKEDDNGLYILHGEAGTGKTTYIRHLIKQLRRNKKFVYVPSNLVDDITSPNFVSFVMDNKNCVFIIEDCENLVVTKNNTRSSAVADMLNMTDGILADALKIKFICTFNTNEKNIDEALLRPGRCRMKYDFKKLDKDRAVKAAEKYNLKKPDKDISLAELFAGENKYIEEKRKIGF